MCAEADSSTFLLGLSGSARARAPDQQVARVCVDNETGYLLEYSTRQDPADDLVAIEVDEPSASDFEAARVPTVRTAGHRELPATSASI